MLPRYNKPIYYAYSKQRKDFGRQPLFQMVPGHIIDSINPNKQEQKLYGLRNPVNREIQAVMPQSEHDAGTNHLVVHEQGINHTEGGWPKDVHLYNEEHVARHRRRVQHEENYIHTVMNVTPFMKHYIDQNNAIDMYQTYFSGLQPQEPLEKYNIRIENVFRDPLLRPVSCVVWTNEQKPKLAVAYCYKSPSMEQVFSDSTVCYLWDVTRQTEPIHSIDPMEPAWQLACSPSDSDVLIAGLQNGTVKVFDVRAGTLAISGSSVYNSHRGSITALLYTHTRTNSEFFTGSTDGQCLWWDMRNLSMPTDRLCMSVNMKSGESPNPTNAESVSTFEFDRNLPTKVLCGTDSGLVININRMGNSHSEKLCSYWEAHTGPVRSVQRSPCTVRMFLTCGDFNVRIWSEEVRVAPIIVSAPYRHEVTDAAWTPIRYSSYMSVTTNGDFYYWDLLRKYDKPVAALQVSKDELTKISPHSEGEHVAVSDSKGVIYLLNLCENMAFPGNNDKQLMHQTYQRETKREHILDMRVKELRLKAKAEEITSDTSSAVELVDEDDSEQIAEDEYFKIVNDELRKLDEMSNI